LGVIVLFGLIYLLTAGDPEPDSNLSVNVNARRSETARTQDTSVPPSSIPVTEAPGSTYPTTSQDVPGTGVMPPQASKGTVVIDAKVSTRSGKPEPVRNTRFYLLDKDVETILSDTDIEPIEGQTLTGSLALATADQSQFGAFYRAAMRALEDHIKYTGSTDSMGKAQLGSVEPDSYYLFGVARTAEGFAMWSSPVSVIVGENAVNLTPQPLTQLRSKSGE
jgi:hypothetical protein